MSPISPCRLTPLNMPDYAEVAGCSSFKNPSSPTYECYGAYATTTLVGRGFHNSFEHKNIYSAPNSVHYNNFLNNSNNSNHQHLNGGSTTALTNNQLKMNIIENKMDHLINNLNGPAGSSSVPHTPMFGTIKRNRMNASHMSNASNASNSQNLNKLASYSDKINFGENGRSMEQPLFIKSKYDGTWKSIPSTNASNGSTNHLSSYHNSPHQSPHHALLPDNNQKSNSHSYLTSFGKSDKV